MTTVLKKVLNACHFLTLPKRRQDFVKLCIKPPNIGHLSKHWQQDYWFRPCHFNIAKNIMSCIPMIQAMKSNP